MKDLIEALTIFAKYQTPTSWPTICVRGVLVVVGVRFDELSEEDANWVRHLGFDWSKEFDNWASFRFGSA